MISFSFVILADRKAELGLTYKEIAKRTAIFDNESRGVTPPTCYSVLTGKCSPTARTLSLICAALSISPRSTFKDQDGI